EAIFSADRYRADCLKVTPRQQGISTVPEGPVAGLSYRADEQSLLPVLTRESRHQSINNEVRGIPVLRKFVLLCNQVFGNHLVFLVVGLKHFRAHLAFGLGSRSTRPSQDSLDVPLKLRRVPVGLSARRRLLIVDQAHPLSRAHGKQTR